MRDEQELQTYWSSYFAEIPRCTVPDCGRIAVQVDSHFPFLDDFNRCTQHEDVSAEDVVATDDE